VSEPARVVLRGVLDRTSSSASIEPDGGLVVELYDFSPDAHTWLGNDVAFLLHVAAADKERVLAELLRERCGEAAGAGEPDGTLLRLLHERFDDYYAVMQWLEEHAIPYRKEFEPWA
jgi:hypothetical protein